MTTTQFTEYSTPVVADWLNDVDQGIYQANSGITGSTARTLTDKLSDIISVKDFGAVGDGVADDTAAINTAIEALNAYEINGLDFGGDEYLISGPLTAIQRSYCVINGNGARLTMDASAGTNGKFFILGGTTAAATRVVIKGFRCVCENTPDDNDFVVDAYRATECHVDDISVTGVASLIRLGSASYASVRNTFSNWRGTCVGAADADAVIDIVRASAARFKDFSISANTACTNGAYVRIAPAAGDVVDTMYFDSVSMQMFTATAAKDGKPYGVKIDRTAGDVTNLWFDKCVFDHTSVKGFYFDGSTGSAARYSRNLNVHQCRFSSDAGGGIFFDNTAGGVLEHTNVLNNFVLVRENYQAYSMVGNSSLTKVLGNSFLEADTTVVKDIAVRLEGSGWIFANNRIATTAATDKFVVGVEVTDVTSDDFKISDNSFGSGVTTRIKEPVYTALSAKRILGGQRQPVDLVTQSAVAASHTGSTAETTLATITIPARAMGPNGSVRINTFWTVPNNANVKTAKVYFGGTAYKSIALTSKLTAWLTCVICNRNSAAAQVGTPTNVPSGATSTLALPTSAVDTDSDVTVLITGTLADGADTITLEGYTIDVAHK